MMRGGQKKCQRLKSTNNLFHFFQHYSTCLTTIIEIPLAVCTYQSCQIISKESSNDLSNFEVNFNSLVLLAYQQRTILKVICKKSIDKAQ